MFSRPSANSRPTPRFPRRQCLRYQSSHGSGLGCETGLHEYLKVLHRRIPRARIRCRCLVQRHSQVGGWRFAIRSRQPHPCNGWSEQRRMSRARDDRAARARQGTCLAPSAPTRTDCLLASKTTCRQARHSRREFHRRRARSEPRPGSPAGKPRAGTAVRERVNPTARMATNLSPLIDRLLNRKVGRDNEAVAQRKDLGARDEAPAAGVRRSVRRPWRQ